jgi:tetratricopeptide (TPR) repeat protein/tRNA A-37 threonylcarbamoyl transferase component Bud32
MKCPQCGDTTVAAGKVCKTCGALVPPPSRVAAGVLTPLPVDQLGDSEVTRLGDGETLPGSATGPWATGTPDHEATRLGTPPPAGTAAAGASTPGGQTTDPERSRPDGGRSSGPLAVGMDFGARYHIIKLLGMGGMGAVYQAWDAELSVPVALKVIRPEITADPQVEEDLQRRFKRELLLARQVTHKNVVRIHDLGEIDGIKYITMPYIHGRDLATVLKRENRLPIARVLPLARQIVAGLVAAHEAGIVHRDLKPANIMVDDEGQASIMDFGIARSTGGPTQTVGVVGTLEYMAPEQASGHPVDQRADVYAFGLILRDLLLGPRQTGGGQTTAIAELMQRMQQAPPSPRAVDATIPEALDRIVARCLAPDAAARYQTSAELAADLARLDAQGHAADGVAMGGAGTSRWLTGRVTLIAAMTACIVAIVVGVWVWDRPAPAVPSEPVSVAVVPFRNASGDVTLDAHGATLAEILRSELGQSEYLRTVPSDRLRQVLRDLRLSSESEFDPQTLRQLGDLINAQTIVWGQYLKIGNQVQVLATLHDLRENGGATTLKADPIDQTALLGAVYQLAGQIRQHLAASPEILKQLAAASFKPSSQSFEALRYYHEGLDLVRQGNHSDAVKRFALATEEDSQFALAYSRLGQAYAALGYDPEAQRFSRRSMELSDWLPPQEKYLIEATHARIRNDTRKALEAYENLAKVSPNDSTILFDLGSLYESTGALQKAHDAYGRALELDPKSVDTLLANGRILIRLQKPQDALDYLNRALSLAIQLSYEVSRANVLHALGVAYRQLDKPVDALKYYGESLEIKRRLGQKSGIAATLNEIGQAHVRLGQFTEATASYNEALALRREIGDKRGVGTVLINLASLQNDTGKSDEALAAFREALQIQREVGNQQLVGVCLNSIGSIYFARGRFEDAVTYFELALPIREKVNVPGETADTLHNLAEAAVKMGQYNKATTEYLRALQLRRGAGDARGAAIESYSMGAVFEQQGRYGAALKAKEEALTAFRALKERGFWLAEILRGYGSALAQAGRMADAQRVLEEALNLSRELGNPVLIAHTLNAQGDRLYFQGDSTGARALYEEALRESGRASDRYLSLIVKVNAARLALSVSPAAMLARLATLEREAEEAGLKYLSIECALHRAQIKAARRDYSTARQELERLIGRSDNLGLRTLSARSHHLLATVLIGQGDAAEARRHYAAALRILEDMRNEEGGADVIKRADLSAIYADSTRAAAER